MVEQEKEEDAADDDKNQLIVKRPLDSTIARTSLEGKENREMAEVAA